MISRVKTAVPIGFDSHLVVVECDITKGLPAFNIVGLPDKAVAESRAGKGSRASAGQERRNG